MASFLLAVELRAVPLRVTTWSIEPRALAQTNGSTRQSESATVQDAAEVLKKLNPDVIILQEVESWQSCDDLIKALRPAHYYLAVCSSFRNAQTGALSRRQVAILSKDKSYISWSESWKSEVRKAAAPGGFAFAAVKVGNKNAGLFSIQLGDTSDGPQSAAQQPEREEAARQLLRQIASVQSWTANRIDAVVVGGDFSARLGGARSADEKTLRLLSDAGLSDAFANVPLDQRVTFPGNGQMSDAIVDYLFTGKTGPAERPQISRVAWSEHYPLTCELDLNAPKPAQPATPKPQQSPAPVAAAKVETPSVKVSESTVGQSNSAPVQAVAPIIRDNRNEGNQVRLKTEKSPQNPSELVSHHDAGHELQAIALPVSPRHDNYWWLVGAGAGTVSFLLLVILWWMVRRFRAQPAGATALAMKVEAGASISVPTDAERIVITHQPAETAGSAADTPTIVHVETVGSSQTQSQAWQRRAEAAERRAEQATEVLRAGLMPHLGRWLKEKLVSKLVSDRARLIETQQAAALKMLAVDERLTRLESQIQQRNQDYEQRIDELMKELAAAKEESREMIRARIELVKAEMERARSRTAP